MANLSGACPVCDAKVTTPADVEESEIISCKDCDSRLVVAAVNKNTVKLDKAPEIEEDWGQ